MQEDPSTLVTETDSSAGSRRWLRSGYDLLFSRRGCEETRFPICYSHLTIGALGPKLNDIAVDGDGISNRQLLLKLIQGQVFLNNLHPKMPVLVNGKAETFCQLRPDDQFSVGAFQFRLTQLSDMVAFVEGYTSPHLRQHWSIERQETHLGRPGLRENHIVLNDPTVSRRHAKISFLDGVYVFQAESERPTYINAVQVTEPKILNDEDIIQLGRQRLRFRTYSAAAKPRALLPRKATILFSDIWNYTTMAESRPLKDTIDQLNQVYKSLGKVIVAHDGILMTYLGDAMMAVFGGQAQAPDGEHETHAVEAAIAMVEALKRLNSEWAQGDFPQLQMGIGVATGEVMLGDVGVTEHLEFAAMGDTTNVAARIEKLTREYRAQVLTNKATADRLPASIPWKSLGPVNVKGRRQPVEVCQILTAE